MTGQQKKFHKKLEQSAAVCRSTTNRFIRRHYRRRRRHIMKQIIVLLLLVTTLIACTPSIDDPAVLGNAPAADQSPTDSPASHLQRIDQQAGDVAPDELALLVQGNNNLAAAIYQTAGQGNEDNLFFSPYSIQMAFAMIYAGAREDTASQMAQVLHLLPQEQHHQLVKALAQELSNLNPDGETEERFQLNVANALWGQERCPFATPFLNTMNDQYKATLQTLDFVNEWDTAHIPINEWIADATENKITDMLKSGMLNRDTRLVLANAIYFDAGWLFSFDTARTRDDDFTRLDGSRITVPMMRQSGTINIHYTLGDGYQAARLPYVGDKADMLIILPDEGQFHKVENQLSADFLANLYQQMGRHDVELSMPRFEMGANMALHDLLPGLGLELPFGAMANFEDIYNPRETPPDIDCGPLYVSRALHRGVITVDEEGTEAAAVTVIVSDMMESVQIVETMTVDRPFIFAIVAKDTQTILFLGRMLSP
jgi:serpin B